jgi:DNA-binding transcriptional LysR family regulator
MNSDSLKRIDLNLLWVFHAVIRKRKLTLAADQLSMTQSAVSHALNRLRDLFDDELFLRTGHGVEPTARALELAPKVALVIEAALSAVAEHASFDPAHDDVTLRIAMLDYEASVIAPRLIEKVRRIAPRVTLVCAHAWRKSAIGMLQDGEAEIALGSMGAPASDIELLPLLDEEWAVVARKATLPSRGVSIVIPTWAPTICWCPSLVEPMAPLTVPWRKRGVIAGSWPHCQDLFRPC